MPAMRKTPRGMPTPKPIVMALLDAGAVDGIGVAVVGKAELMPGEDDCGGKAVTTREVVGMVVDRDNELLLAVELVVVDVVAVVVVVGVVSITAWYVIVVVAAALGMIV